VHGDTPHVPSDRLSDSESGDALSPTYEQKERRIGCGDEPVQILGDSQGVSKGRARIFDKAMEATGYFFFMAGKQDKRKRPSGVSRRAL